MRDLSFRNTVLKKVIKPLIVLLSMIVLLLLFLLIKHTQMFPVIYLTAHKEKVLTEFSEKILEAFDKDGKTLVIDQWGLITRDRELLTENQQEMVDEMYRFCNTKGFSVIHVSDKEKFVIYRHYIGFHYVTDYMYRLKSNNPEIKIRTYKR